MTQLTQKLPTLGGDCADQHGSLDIFYINNIKSFEYDIQDFDWNNKSILGKGSFADVYKSEIIRKKRPVALKVFTLFKVTH